MKSILVLMCLCFIGASSVYGTSKRVLDFLNYYNGEFDNKAQTKKDGDDHDEIQLRLVPVDIKCFGSQAAVFLEVVVNKTIRIFTLGLLTDGIEDTVSMTVFNFTDYSKFKPFEYNIQNLSNISCEDLQGDKDCIASYRVAREGYAFGNYPNCRYTVKREHPRFTTVHTCTSFSSTMPQYSLPRSPIEPYEIQLTGKKFPLPGIPEGYVPPCANTTNVTNYQRD